MSDVFQSGSIMAMAMQISYHRHAALRQRNRLHGLNGVLRCASAAAFCSQVDVQRSVACIIFTMLLRVAWISLHVADWRLLFAVALHHVLCHSFSRMASLLIHHVWHEPEFISHQNRIHEPEGLHFPTSQNGCVAYAE